MRARIGILILTLICSLAKASEHYISSASDLNNLVSGNMLQPGDKVIMRNGIWNSQTITFKGTGTETNPITLMAETAGSVILSGNSGLVIDGKWLVVDGLSFSNGSPSSSHLIRFTATSTRCRLTNTSVVNYNPSLRETDNKWVSLYGTYNRVDHCEFTGKDSQGATLVVWLADQPNYHRIDHNYFGPRPVFGANGAETIRVGTSQYGFSDSYTTIEENIFDRCDGEGEIISVKSMRNTVRNNFFYECRGAVTLRHGNNNEVSGNYFIGNKKQDTGGVRIIGENHQVFNNYFYGLTGSGLYSPLSIMNANTNPEPAEYWQVKNAQVIGNTFIDCGIPISIGVGASSTVSLPPVNSLIANNIILVRQSPLITWTDASASHPQNIQFDNNLAYGVLPSQVNTDGIIIDDPLLQLNSYTIYEPETGSPAKNNFQGNFSFYDTDDIGAKPMSSLYEALLRGQGIGASWMNIPQFVIKQYFFGMDPGEWNSLKRTLSYNLGAGTSKPGMGKTFTATNGASSVSMESDPGFLPYISTNNGGGSVKVQSSNANAGFVLQDNDPANASLKITASGTSAPAKFSLYDIKNTSPVTSLFFTITFKDSTYTQVWWNAAMGNNTGAANIFSNSNAVAYSGTTSNPEIFNAFRWQVSRGNPNVINFQYRSKPGAGDEVYLTTATSSSFFRGGEYAIEVYANNLAFEQAYIRGGITYNIPSGKYHIWSNGERLFSEPDIYEFPANQLALGTDINSFMIYGSYGSSTPSSEGTAIGDSSAELIVKNISMGFADVVTTPITLASFDVRKQKDGVLLHWKTSPEINHSHFEILRSADGKKFSVIGNKKAGDFDSINHYSFADRSPINGINYYQLGQVGHDGTGQFSAIRSVNFGLEEINGLKVFIAQNKEMHFAYVAESDTASTFCLFDTAGKKRIEQKVQLKKGDNYLPVNAKLPAGIYMALLKTGDKTAATKFIMP